MKTVSVVVGANFGDEGKGLMTDFLSKRESLVVRFNGGAQAGHTVVEPDGRRHVFHHFGSGTFNGASTYLSKHFLVNPMAFVEEAHRLTINSRMELPRVYVDPRARVSTPWDMMLNQAVETKRSGSRHGSCGLGIHETVTRSLDLPLYVKDLFGPAMRWRTILNAIINEYAPARAAQLEVELPAVAKSEGLLTHFLHDIDTFKNTVSDVMWNPALLEYVQSIVFEGAQGLRLDQDSPFFPHVTCSKTGLKNVIDMVDEGGLREETLNVFYCTRPYITRHGAGPLKHELWEPPTKKVVDITNKPNEWQGSLRFGTLDVEEFATFVRGDWKAPQGYRIAPQLALTCLDQLEEERVNFYYRGQHKDTHWRNMAGAMMADAGLDDGYVSFGPTRKDVKRI